MAGRRTPRLGRAPLAAVVAVTTVVTACTDTLPVETRPSAPQPSATAPAETKQPTPSIGPHGTGEFIGAEIAPVVASAGQDVVVRPVEAVTPTCGVTLAFYDPYLWGDRELIGVLLGTGEWAPFDPSVTTTLLACVPPPVSAPLTARLPDGLADGLYQACIGAIGSAHGCNLLRVIRPGEIDSDAAEGAAEPVVVAPGEGFTLTPADDDALVCGRFELVVGVGAELELVGFPTPDGDVYFDVPGATTTAPRCGIDTGVPPGPVTFVAPDVPDGSYLFCLASRFDPPGCARVTIER